MQKSDDGPLADANYPGVFLGYGRENSTFLVGRWKPDGRARDGVKFGVEENATISKWFESILIHNIDDLKTETVTVPLKRYLDGGGLGDLDSDLVR